MYNTHKGVEEIEIHYKRGDKNSVAYIVGEVDHHNAKTARESIDKRIAEYGSECFGLDLSGVTFCDSSGLGLVMGRMKKCAECGSELIILNPSPAAYKILKIAGMDKLLKIRSE